MHVRQLNGRSLRFGHRGWLWHGAFILYDVGTDSLWHHQTGRALAGSLRGQALARLPTTLSTWSEWLAAHPETQVLPKPPDVRFREDGYAERTALLELGLSVELEGRIRLYPLDAFGKDGVLHDTLENRAVVLALHRQRQSGSGFLATLGDRTLRFTASIGAGGVRQLIDADSGGRWNVLSGRPLDGSKIDAPLTPLIVTLWDRAAWTRQHPHGDVFKRP